MRVHYSVIGLVTLLGRFASAQNATAASRAPLSYAPTPADIYEPTKRNDTLTLIDFIESRPELSRLLATIKQPAGFTQAFDTDPTWSFTFFAPSNTAFENIGEYFTTFEPTPKGKWWLGNLLTHHYVPNSALQVTAFNSTPARLQSGNYLYIGTQVVDGTLVLNNVSRVTEADIPVTSGIVHIIDRVLDPSAQIFESDLPKVQKQAFIPGSCADQSLAYC